MHTIDQYMNALTPERRHALSAIWELIATHIDPVFEAGMHYGVPGFHLPHSIYPDGYHVNPQPVPFASIVSQKRHTGL